MSIALDPERHRELVAALARAVAAMSAELDALESATSDLRPRWSGTARLAYDRAHHRWNSSMAIIRNALDAATADAVAAADILAQANREAAALWR